MAGLAPAMRIFEAGAKTGNINLVIKI